MKSRYSFFKPTASAYKKSKVTSRPGRRNKRRTKAIKAGVPKFLRKIGLNSAALSMKGIGQLAPPTQASAFSPLSALKPKNIAGVVPIFLGAVSTAWLASYLSKKVPYTRQGVGKYALSLVIAGLGGATGSFYNKNYAVGALLGGVVETLSSIYKDVRSGGIRSVFSLGSYDTQYFGQSDGLVVSDGLGVFVTPTDIEHSGPTESRTSQYSVPSTMSLEQHAHDTHAQQYEDNVLGAVMTPNDSGF